MNDRLFEYERNTLVDALISSGHLQPGSLLEAAMRSVPRHALIPNLEDPLEAYQNKTFVFKRDAAGSILGKGRTLCSSTMPGLVAAILQHAEIGPNMRVLEVGTSSGYTAAVMSEVVGADGQIVTLEIDEEALNLARATLDALGYSNVTVIMADGWVGCDERGPYDRIVVTASCTDVSPYWVGQLREGGHLMVPLSFSSRAGLYPFIRFTKRGKNLCGVVSPSLVAVGFVPLYGSHTPHPLEYDSSMSVIIEKQLPAMLLKRQPIDRESVRSAILVAEIELSLLADEGRTINPEDTQFVEWILDQWERYGRPTCQDFVFYLIPGLANSSEYQWYFAKACFDLGIMITSYTSQ